MFIYTYCRAWIKGFIDGERGKPHKTQKGIPGFRYTNGWIKGHAKRHVIELFVYNEALVISDGYNARWGHSPPTKSAKCHGTPSSTKTTGHCCRGYGDHRGRLFDHGRLLDYIQHMPYLAFRDCLTQLHT